MPIYEFLCEDCGGQAEILVLNPEEVPACPSCGGGKLRKLLSATSSLTGKTGQGLPGAGDTACCGQSPGHAGCAGPGSCCGKA